MGGAASRRPQELHELVVLQFAVFVAVVSRDQSLDFVVAETEAVHRRFHLGQRHGAVLVAVELVEHLANLFDPTSSKPRMRALAASR